MYVWKYILYPVYAYFFFYLSSFITLGFLWGYFFGIELIKNGINLYGNVYIKTLAINMENVSNFFLLLLGALSWIKTHFNKSNTEIKWEMQWVSYFSSKIIFVNLRRMGLSDLY